MVGLTNTRIKKATKGSGGIISVIAKKCNVSRLTIYNRMAKSEDLRIELNQAREELTDVAESKLVKNIENGDMGAIKFYLATQGKKRGYVEKTETEHTGTPLMTTNVIAIKNEVHTSMKPYLEVMDIKAKRKMLEKLKGGN